MVKNKNGLYYIFVLVSIYSCVVIQISPPDSVSVTYNKFLKDSNYKVKFNSTNFCDLSFTDTIYAIKGKELKVCLAEKEKAMVYLFSPFCHGEGCLSIGAVQEYCATNNYELFVVIEKYDTEIIEVQVNPQKPFFSIDHYYHKSNSRNKHVKSFLKELLGKEKMWGRYFEFNNGDFVKMIEIPT